MRVDAMDSYNLEMTWLWFGEDAVLVQDLELAPYEVARRWNASLPHGVSEAVAGTSTVLLAVRPGFDPESLSIPAADIVPEPRVHEIPVDYNGGEDLTDVAEQLGLTPAQVAEAHASAEYVCFAVGFRPGFGYLQTLPEELRGLPRRSSPRVRVEAGSVGITGKQTGIYPQAGPGGWWLIGRTELPMVRPDPPFGRLVAGDRVRFVPEARVRA